MKPQSTRAQEKANWKNQKMSPTRNTTTRAQNSQEPQKDTGIRKASSSSREGTGEEENVSHKNAPGIGHKDARASTTEPCPEEANFSEASVGTVRPSRLRQENKLRNPTRPEEAR